MYSIGNEDVTEMGGSFYQSMETLVQKEIWDRVEERKKKEERRKEKEEEEEERKNEER